jgi:hypothetical protein
MFSSCGAVQQDVGVDLDLRIVEFERNGPVFDQASRSCGAE